MEMPIEGCREEHREETDHGQRRRLYWEQTITDQSSSGLGVSKFCQERKIKLSTFYQWKRHLKLETKGKALSQPEEESNVIRFIPLSMKDRKSEERAENDQRTKIHLLKAPPEMEMPPWEVKLIFPNGHRMELRSRANKAWMGWLVQTISELGC